MTALDAAARAQLDAWAAAIAADPSRQPGGFAVVQARLVRWVARANLGNAGEVYAKVMGFPRRKDRLRYVLRSLPAIHEARLLEWLARSGVPCPQVVAARGWRRNGLPHASLLVTRALPVADPRPEFADMARAALALAELGLFHPDLNPANFVRLRDGRTAVLDLQSARRVGAPLRAALRRHMAAKLWVDGSGDAAGLEQLGAVGLVARSNLAAVERLGRRLMRRAFERRVRRCLTESTEFRVERHVGATVHWRRDASDHGEWIAGGRELVRLWIGQRVCELTSGEPATIAALFRTSWWRPGPHRVYIPAPDAQAALARHRARLLDAELRFRTLGGAGASACTTPARGTTTAPTDHAAADAQSRRREP